MTPSKNNILVRFDPVPTINGLTVPERYLIQDADTDGEHDAYGVTTNRKAINPQVVTILQGEHEGKKAFVYYGAYEIAKWPEPEIAVIPEGTLLFFIEPIRPISATYLGEEVFAEGERTASGIYITPFAEKKEGILIKITHVPEHGGVRYGERHIIVGDIVVTIDAAQYDMRYEDQKYIKLRSSEIVGVKTETGFVPVGTKVLIEYLADEDLLQRQEENARRLQILETMSKRYLHLGDMPDGQLPEHLQPVKEPKVVKATIISIGDKVNLLRFVDDTKVGDTAMVFRNYGCMLPNKQWITDIDNVVGVMTE